jgi:hypothetical protein
VLIRYRTIDIRELDGERLLESPDLGDNLLAILARLRDRREAFRKILEKMSGLPAHERADLMSQLILLAGLRRSVTILKEEAKRMPVHFDLRENEILGPPYIKGLEEGEQKGLQQGRQEGELVILRRLMQKRFGALPAWAEERLASRSAAELEELSDRVLEASSLEDLLK